MDTSIVGNMAEASAVETVIASTGMIGLTSYLTLAAILFAISVCGYFSE